MTPPTPPRDAATSHPTNTTKPLDYLGLQVFTHAAYAAANAAYAAYAAAKKDIQAKFCKIVRKYFPTLPKEDKK